jgi:signal transduction histidine kinase
MVLDETRQAGDQPVAGGAFATLDLVLRVAVGVGLALVIMGWISKPLSRLAESADATLPNGEIRPGAVPFAASEAPTEIAHTLAAFDRMRGRIGAMVSERTTMLTALAHDLRTPITRLMLRLELSKDEKLRTEAYRDCEKMQQLISRTLDFIRSSEKGATLGLLTLDVLIAQVVATLAADEQQRCVLDLPAGEVLVYANAWGLERAIANVIDNALKYSPPTSLVNVSLTASEGRVNITVADLGPGVPEDLLPRLREPFFRVDSARNLDEGGAGLGLSIVDNLVKLYGGDVVINNRANGGLAVTISLAMAKAN